ncbi:hypothetical protein IJ103_00020 [Candidatus Saccharibacteria bacterium]|nr:hypothetical protein [Candidatus Saccharibacteria bacterium]
MKENRNNNVVVKLFSIASKLYKIADETRATATGSDYFAAHGAACVLEPWQDVDALRPSLAYTRGVAADVLPINKTLAALVANVAQAAYYLASIDALDDSQAATVARAIGLTRRVEIGGGHAWLKW